MKMQLIRNRLSWPKRFISWNSGQAAKNVIKYNYSFDIVST